MTNEQRFSGKADVYNSFRPSYPKAIIDYIWLFLTQLDKRVESIVIADIGAGTGKFTRLLLERGLKVVAVEPNEDMASKLSELQKEFPLSLTIQAGTAEQTKLADQSIDLIVCAQAFHWVDEQLAKAEWKRILKIDGAAALIWNQRAIDANDFMRSYEQLFIAFDSNHKEYGSYRTVGHQYVNRESLTSFYGVLPDYYSVPYVQPLNEQAFIGRITSSSYAPRENDERYEAFIDEAKRIFNLFKDEQTDTVSMLYNSVCYIKNIN